MSDATTRHIAPAAEANCKRPSEGGVPNAQPEKITLAPSLDRDRQVGQCNLMMSHCNTLPTAC